MQASVVTPVSTSLVPRKVAFDDIPRAAWDRLLARTAAATPFSRWTFHRAWWDAYGPNAHEQYLLMTGADDADIRAIVPLMHRHEVEPQDLPTHTTVREHSPTCRNVPGEAKAIMFGASYHADYATLLADPSEVNTVAETMAATFAGRPERFDGDQPWDVIDLRRLRDVDPALTALELALADVGAGQGWRVEREQEDVCPVITVRGDTWDEYLATLGKSDRHEIRRKLRRANTIGDLSIEIGPPTGEAIDDFVRLHTMRFGERGLFPDNEGGARSRRFVDRLAELELSEPDGGQLHVARVRCGQKLIFVALAFDDGQTCFLYNAGMDPTASMTSPGVSGVALYIRDRLDIGRRRFDFLRGNEKYKYEWGAVDEPIYRLLVTRGDAPL
ncbi:MAG: GNAT family N-acetyltransferase [Candidatus Limnocylindrales bacterium]